MKKQPKKTFHILVDMDEVMADLATPWSEWIRSNGDPDFKWETVTTWHVNQFTTIGKKAYDALAVEGLFLFLEPIEGSIEGVNVLRKKGHRIQFCTSNPTEQSKDEKIEWLKDKFKWFKPETDIIFSHDKTRETGDILIDDRAKWVFEFPGISICMAANYNKHYPGFRVSTWPEIVKLVEQISKVT